MHYNSSSFVWLVWNLTRGPWCWGLNPRVQNANLHSICLFSYLYNHQLHEVKARIRIYIPDRGNSSLPGKNKHWSVWETTPGVRGCALQKAPGLNTSTACPSDHTGQEWPQTSTNQHTCVMDGETVHMVQHTPSTYKALSSFPGTSGSQCSSAKCWAWPRQSQCTNSSSTTSSLHQFLWEWSQALSATECTCLKMQMLWFSFPSIGESNSGPDTFPVPRETKQVKSNNTVGRELVLQQWIWVSFPTFHVVPQAQPGELLGMTQKNKN